MEWGGESTFQAGGRAYAKGLWQKDALGIKERRAVPVAGI